MGYQLATISLELSDVASQRLRRPQKVWHSLTHPLIKAPRMVCWLVRVWVWERM